MILKLWALLPLILLLVGLYVGFYTVRPWLDTRPLWDLVELVVANAIVVWYGWSMWRKLRRTQ